MPETAHQAGFLASEWARFWQGWNALSPQQQSEAEARAFGRQGALNGQGSVNVPGWDDVIHVAPKYKPSREEAQAWFDAKRAGDTSRLPAQVNDAMEARQDALDRMASSAQPGYSQAFGSMLTAVDNVQDMLSTVATLGRVTVNPALRALAHFAPELAAKLGARLIPGIGWVLGAADLLALLTWLGLGGLIGYGALCGGLKAAAAPALVQGALKGVPGLRPCGGKAKVGQLADLNPFAAAGRLKNLNKAARAMPGFGQWLEAAQTTDQLWGVGISLGGLAGAAMEAAYAATGANRGQGVRVDASKVTPSAGYRGPAGGTLTYNQGLALVEQYAPRALELARARPPAQLAVFWRMARALMDAPMLLANVADLTPQDYAATLVVHAHATDALRRELAGGDVDGLAAAVAGLSIGAPVDVQPVTAALLGRHPDQGGSVGRWAMPGAPRELLGGELAAHYARELPAALRARLAPIRNTAPGMWLGGLVNHTAAVSWQLLTGEADPFVWNYSPEFVVLQSLMDSSRYLSSAEDPEALWSYWQDATGRVSQDARRSLLPSELDQLAQAHGLRYIYAEQPYMHGELQPQV